MREWSFIFCLRFRRHFFRHTDFLRFQKKNFFKNLDFRCHRKMYRLVSCIPIFRGYFLLKMQKGCVYMIMLKIALVLFQIYVLVGKKGISGLARQIAAKDTGQKKYVYLAILVHLVDVVLGKSKVWRANCDK